MRSQFCQYSRAWIVAAGLLVASALACMPVAFGEDAAEEDAARIENTNLQTLEKIGRGELTSGRILIESGSVLIEDRDTALRHLIELRRNTASFRFFQFINRRSLFDPPAAYMFILLVLCLGVKLVELPLYVRVAAFERELEDIAPQIRVIRAQHAKNPALAQAELKRLFTTIEFNPLPGCGLVVLDFIFFIWAIIAFSVFWPQLALDRAAFLWIRDVTAFNAWIVAGALVVLLQTRAITARQSAYHDGDRMQVTCGTFLIGAGIFGAAYYWKWPAYAFIFWIFLTLSGLLMTQLLRLIYRMRD